MKREIIQGKIQGNERGYGFLICEDREKDYFIPHGELKGAQHGDTVLCETTSNTGYRTTARVLKIVERGISELVGTYHSSRSGGFVVPDERRYFTDIFIPSGKGVRAKTGDKVVCKILTYPKRLSPEGIITKILGKNFERNAELKAICFNYRLADKFPKNVTDYANNLPKVKERDLKNRRDFRNIACFTIDGEDSRDFDDAVSVEKTADGKYLLGVHIADVTHYVKSGDVIDKEAFQRGTSVYFPESVIPMLPERLSNDLCSLKEGTDRLTLSCIMTVDKAGNVVDSEIVPSVIKSRHRLTYGKVQKILDGDSKLINEYLDVVPDLEIMDELCSILCAKREALGSVNLDVNESLITVDKNGEISILPQARDRAHKIIEEFMILANTTVAEFMFYLEAPFIYRVHNKPETERLEDFYAFLDGLGVKVKRKKDCVFPKDFQTILKNAEGLPFYVIINRVMLRSMQKAKYSAENFGHFGLALKHYCHFTSPIRRYPDLAIHRIIKDLLSGEKNLALKYADFVVSASKHSSETERNAIEAERAVDDYYKILYIENFIGEEFDAVISGVTDFGIFAELNNGVEGLIKIDNLPGNGFKFDNKTYTLSNSDISYRLGERVRIAVAGVDISSRRAEFLLAE